MFLENLFEKFEKMVFKDNTNSVGSIHMKCQIYGYLLSTSTSLAEIGGLQPINTSICTVES